MRPPAATWSQIATPSLERGATGAKSNLFRLQAAPAMFYGMDRAHWQKELRKAEAELEAARTLTAVKVAARKLQRAKTELKSLEDAPAERPKRRASRGRASGATSS
jgi:uncharacterized protein YPO0396